VPGAMFSELADALSVPKHRLELYVAHDLSIVRLAAGLEIFPLRWPRLGSEIVIEVRRRLPRSIAADRWDHIDQIWKDQFAKKFVRVFYDGELVGSLSWVPLNGFISRLRRQVPEHLYERCMSTKEDMKFLLPLNFTMQKSRLDPEIGGWA
jgi:hypothetical protein